MATDTILHIAALGDRLHVTNALDVSTMGAEISVQDGLKPAQLREVILTADGGLAGTSFDTNKTDFTEHYMLYDFALDYTVATNVTVVSVPAVDGEISTALSYAGLQGVRAGFNGMQGAVFARTKQLRRNSVATDHAIPHEAYLMSQTNAPSGAYGPGDKNTIFGMHFWAEQFGGQGDYNGVGLSDGFTLNNNGTTFGFDRLVGEDLVAGINYTYARSAASATNGDEVDTETYWLGLYSEWLHENGWYVDALAGLGWSNYDTVRTETGYHGIGSFRGTDLAGTIDAGKYLQFGNWALAPYAGLHYLWVKSDGYTEIEEFGNQLQVEGLDVASLDSALGVKLRNRFDTRIGRFQTVGYAEWMYDFINDDISTTLSDGATTVKTAGISPDANLLNAGLGLGWICTDYLEVGIGYDGRFNQNYEEHTGSIMLDVRF
jgi:outer membrane autotransporter protein